MSKKKILVLLSGGQDSATALAMALQKYGPESVYCASVYYGQRHSREVLLAQILTKKYVRNPLMDKADKIRQSPNSSLEEIEDATNNANEVRWRLLDMSFLQNITTTSALTGVQTNPSQQKKHDAEEYAVLTESKLDVLGLPFPVATEETSGQATVGNAPSPYDARLPNSFVPGRNLIFFSAAVALAANLGCSEIWTGVCEADYSGYPDCREGFVRTFEDVANLALGADQCKIRVITPLMHMTKAQEVQALHDMGEYYFSVLSYTNTDYHGEWPPKGDNPATVLREKGFKEAGIRDPLLLRDTDPLLEYNEDDYYELALNLNIDFLKQSVYAHLLAAGSHPLLSKASLAVAQGAIRSLRLSLKETKP